MDTARIADRLNPFLEQSLSEFQLHQISTYIDLLLHWNARINLTAIRNEEEIVTRHFGESLFAASHLFPPYPVTSSVSPACPEQSRRVVKDFEVDSAGNKRPTTNIRVADLGSGSG